MDTMPLTDGRMRRRWLLAASLGCVLCGCTKHNPAYLASSVSGDGYQSTDATFSYDGSNGRRDGAVNRSDSAVSCAAAQAGRCDGSVLIACIGGSLARVSCPRGCRAGKCVDCTMRRYYRDRDQDGYGQSNASKLACERPSGYAGRGGDCDDSDADAHPGQTHFFSSPRNGGGYDYNCDGLQQPGETRVANCRRQGWQCVGNGWEGGVPACGAQGTFALCRSHYGGCRAEPDTVRQRCR